METSEKVRKLIDEYETFNDQERAEFDSLIAPREESPISPVWLAELHSRAEDIDSGRVELISGVDFLKRWRAS